MLEQSIKKKIMGKGGLKKKIVNDSSQEEKAKTLQALQPLLTTDIGQTVNSNNIKYYFLGVFRQETLQCVISL